MIDFAECPAGLLDAPAMVLDSLESNTGWDGASLMLIGAGCRDILHAAQGHGFSLRATSDLDLAIAISSWPAYAGIVGGLTAIGHTGVRYLVSGLPVDIMPFGPVEEPIGTVVPAARREALDVFAFSEVFATSVTPPLGGGHTIRIPTPAGYAALKLKAWADRSAVHNDKDAPDLATALWWYLEAPDMGDRVFGGELSLERVQDFGFDRDLCAPFLLGTDVAAAIGAERCGELVTALRSSDLALLAERMKEPRLSGWPNDAARRRHLVDALLVGLL